MSLKLQQILTLCLVIAITVNLYPVMWSSVRGNTQTEKITSLFQSDLRRNYSKFVVITWDGVRSKWLDEYSEKGDLPVSQAIRTEGGEAYIEILDHTPGTDPGLACIETGYGPNVTGIDGNQFSAGSPKLRIPEGMQTSERLKADLGLEFKTGHLNSWMYHDMNDSYYGLQNGHLNQEEMLDSIFLNAILGEDVDYWFGSENITWLPENEEAHHASFAERWHGSWINGTTTDGLVPPDDPSKHLSYGYITRFSPTYQKMTRYWTDPLIHAGFLAEKASEFITMYKNQPFYLRIHLTEPDQMGHGHLESVPGTDYQTISPEYLLSLQECDNATGVIREALIENGIYEDTFLLIGSDHGFYGSGHDGSDNDQVTTTLWISNQRIWENDGSKGYPAYGWQNDIQPTILALAGIDWTTIDYPGSQPLYIRYDSSEPEISHQSTVVDSSSIKITVKLQDRSGISNVHAQIQDPNGVSWLDASEIQVNNDDNYTITYSGINSTGTYKCKIIVQDGSSSSYQSSEVFSVFFGDEGETSSEDQSANTSASGLWLMFLSISVIILNRKSKKP